MVVYFIYVKPSFHDMSCKESCTWIQCFPCFSYPILTHEKMGNPMLPMLFQNMRNVVPCFSYFSMLFEVMKIRTYHSPHAFPCCLKSWEDVVPCFPCFPMIFKNPKKVLSHGFHPNPCSADVAWKIFPCFPMLLQSRGKQGKLGEQLEKPWSFHEFRAFLHQGL